MRDFLSANLAYAAKQTATTGLDISVQPIEAGWHVTAGGGSRTASATHSDVAEATRRALVELTL